MPSCSNLLCKCKPNNQSSERRSLGKRKKTEGCEWLKFREYDMPIPTPSHDEIIVEIDACLANIIKESVTYLLPKWKHLPKLDINNSSTSKYVRTLICVYNQTADCNARMKIEYSGLKNKITLYWYTFSSAHGMPYELNNRFLNFDVHHSFVHCRVSQKSEFDTSTNSVELTIELQESIEKVLASSPNVSPSHLLRELKEMFVSYSETFWVKAEKSVKAYRNTLLKKYIHGNQQDPSYHTDSIYAIKRWTLNNTFDKVSQHETFNIFTLFVASYDIQPDNSPPPISREDRKKWKPQHKLRIVLCSIAMAMNFPLLQLKPSLLRYLCISADSTFKLTIFKSIKVFFIFIFIFIMIDNCFGSIFV